jgi:hypothetical protein
MAEIDSFANQLLEEAKRFLEKATESGESACKNAHLHAALMLAFCAFEAHINSIADEFAVSTNLSAHEKGLILERDVRLKGGEFQLQKGLKMSRLEERIEFIHTRFSGKRLDHASTWWSHLSTAIDLRNQLTHVKTVPNISEEAVKSAILAIVMSLDALYQSIYKRTFPVAGMGLQSALIF